MSDYKFVERGIEKIKGRIGESSPANIGYVEEYVSFMQANNKHIRTVYRFLYSLEQFLNKLEGKDAKLATKADIQNVVRQVNESAYSDVTKSKVKIAIKAFYKHLLGDDFGYPDKVAWIKSSFKMKPRFTHADLLTEDDVQKMLDVTKHERDRAIIALLFESGIRPGELVNMRIKDLELETQPAHIAVDGKTGPRRIPIVFSVPYLARYANTLSGRSRESLLWSMLPGGVPSAEPLSQPALNKMLKKMAKKAGISKKMTAYVFRHSHLTWMATKIPESVLRRRAGWANDSEMPATYVHLSQEEDDRAYLQANGLTPISPRESRLKPVTCLNCGSVNEVSAIYCVGCGSALSKISISQELNANLKELLIATLKDPAVVEEVAKAILEEDYKHKSGRK